MEISAIQKDSIYIVSVVGRWDAYSATIFEEKCTELIEEGMRQVVFDLSNVDYISSFGLRSLLNIGKAFDAFDGTIAICSMRPYISKLFVGSGFASLFPDFPSIEEGISYIKNQ